MQSQVGFQCRVLSKTLQKELSQSLVGHSSSPQLGMEVSRILAVPSGTRAGCHGLPLSPSTPKCHLPNTSMLQSKNAALLCSPHAPLVCSVSCRH